MDDQELDYEEVDVQENFNLNREDEEEDKDGNNYETNVEDARIDRQEQIATEKAFGIDPKTGDHLRITHREGAALRKELEVDGNRYELRAALVNGVEEMNSFQIRKIFSAFKATEVTKLDETRAVVQFALRQDVAAMMLNMTKMLKRVRCRRKADEDGEVMSDGEDEVEDGQIMRETGDDVEVVDVLVSNENGIVEDESDADHIVIDVNVRKIPDGKWRVVTKHVPNGKFLIVRYPTVQEYQIVVKNNEEQEDFQTTRKRGATESEFWTHETKHRGGLNMFDKDGNELDWDYEHDTRFYDEGQDKKAADAQQKFELPKGIKVRGRGAVKCGFLFGEKTSSLTSDDTVVKKKTESSTEYVKYDKDDVLSRVKPSTSLEGRISYRE